MSNKKLYWLIFAGAAVVAGCGSGPDSTLSSGTASAGIYAKPPVDKCVPRPGASIDSTRPWSGIRGWLLLPPRSLSQAAETIDQTQDPNSLDVRERISAISGQTLPDSPLLVDSSTLTSAESESAAGNAVVLPYEGRTVGGVPVPFAVTIRGDNSVSLIGACDWMSKDFNRTSANLIGTGVVSDQADLLRKLASTAANSPTELWKKFLAAQNEPNTSPTSPPWMQRPRDKRSFLDRDAPAELLANQTQVVTQIDMPAGWHFATPYAIFWRNMLAYGTCLQMFGPKESAGTAIAKMLSVTAAPGDNVEFFVGDASKAQDQSFVTSLGTIRIEDLQLAGKDGVTSLVIDATASGQPLGQLRNPSGHPVIATK